MNDYIVLIRRRPSPDGVLEFMRDLRETLQTCKSPLVFFQGDGVEAANDTGLGWPESSTHADWCVCRTSLERRSQADGLPPSFRLATLVTFYQAVLSARRVDSLGLGGRFCCRPEQGERTSRATDHVLLEVGFSPLDQRQRRETLEMVLGAAALELDASVLFHGNGVAHLAGDAARAWAQITDFGLLEMYAEVPGRLLGPEIAVQTLDAARAADLRARAATILIL